MGKLVRFDENGDDDGLLLWEAFSVLVLQRIYPFACWSGIQNMFRSVAGRNITRYSEIFIAPRCSYRYNSFLEERVLSSCARSVMLWHHESLKYRHWRPFCG